MKRRLTNQWETLIKFRMVKSVKESKEQIGNILRLLQMYGQSKNSCSKMIKKNYKRLAKSSEEIQIEILMHS